MHRIPTRLAPLLGVTLLLAACSPSPDDSTVAPERDTATIAAAAADITVIVHRTESCECCGEYEGYLEAAGFAVVQEMHEDLVEVKADAGIPDGERSCHTNEVAGYAVEGHMPAEAILDLVDTTPAVDGISLAGMPAGSPGMPGEQSEPFVVTAFTDGEVVEEFGRY